MITGLLFGPNSEIPRFTRTTSHGHQDTVTISKMAHYDEMYMHSVWTIKACYNVTVSKGKSLWGQLTAYRKFWGVFLFILSGMTCCVGGVKLYFGWVRGNTEYLSR